jgi:hypothetical protein
MPLQMVIDESTSEERARHEQQQLSARGMSLLTGGLTGQGDTFLIAVGAVFLMGALYPLVDAWSLLAFPAVFIASVIIRQQVRRRREAGRSRAVQDL